jgi:hypothetical protein
VDRRKPKPKTLSRAERDAQKLTESIEILSQYAHADVLADLYARAEETAAVDGYPAGGGQSDIHGGRLSDPTEEQVEKAARGRIIEHDDGTEETTPDTWEPYPDPLGDFVGEFQGQVSEIHGLAKLAHKRATVVLKAADSYRGRQSSLQGVCAACGRDVAGSDIDRLRSGYCDACYRSWIRAGMPDRPKFEKARPKSDEGKVGTR